MTVIVERAVVAVVKLECPSLEDADQAFSDLRTRVGFTLPKLRFGKCSVVRKHVLVYAADVFLPDGTIRLGALHD